MSPMEKAGQKPGQLYGTGKPLLYYRWLGDGKTKVYVHRNGKTKKPTTLKARALKDARIEQDRRFPVGGFEAESDGNARFSEERWEAFVLSYDRRSTQRAYRHVWKKHLEPVLDGKRIESEVDRTVVKKIDTELKRQGYSMSTRARVQKSLSAFYRKAIEQGVASRNPVTMLARDDKVGYEAARQIGKDEIPTDAELAAIVEGALADNGNAHVYATIFELAPLLGLRISEMLGLCWERIDFEEGHILVNRQLDEKFRPADPSTWFVTIEGGDKAEEKLKNRRYRLVPMTPQVIAILRKHLLWMYDGAIPLRPEGLVFQTRKGTPVGHEAVRQALLRAASRAGVTKRMYFHLFRHTCASIQFEAGVPLPEIASYLGDSEAVMSDTYVTLLKESKERAAALAEKLAARSERLAS